MSILLALKGPLLPTYPGQVPGSSVHRVPGGTTQSPVSNTCPHWSEYGQ